MKTDFTTVVALGTTVITTIGICTWLGYRYNHLVLGILGGFVMAMMYLFAQVFKK